MPQRIFLLVLLVLATPALLLSQRTRRQGVSDYVLVRVNVTDEENRPVQGIMVQLLSGMGYIVYQTYTNEQGGADLSSVESGRYKIRASSPEIEEATGAEFEIRPGQGYYSAVLSVRRVPKTRQTVSGFTVSVEDLNVPAKAKADFDKGTDALNHNQFAEAREYLEKAIQAYPTYSAAYNNLGIAWLKEDRTEEGSAALRKAISLNPHLTSAYRNLAGVTFRQGKLPETEDLLSRSLVDNPSDAEGLALLSKVQLARGEMDEAIANAKKVHAQPHERYAFVHFIAASAFKAQGQGHEAIREYKTFLKEAPNHSSAPEARAAIQTLQARNH